MEIGKEDKPLRVEPVEDPFRRATPAPVEPVKTPTPVKEPVKTPAGV